jgi:hypothetical protein
MTPSEALTKSIKYHSRRMKELKQKGKLEDLCIEEFRKIEIKLYSKDDFEDGYKLYYTKNGNLSHGVYYFRDFETLETISIHRDDLKRIEKAFNITLLKVSEDQLCSLIHNANLFLKIYEDCCPEKYFSDDNVAEYDDLTKELEAQNPKIDF